MRDMVVAGPKAIAETANVQARIIDLNILEEILGEQEVGYIVAILCSKQ